jgi:hypothetical protein
MDSQNQPGQSTTDSTLELTHDKLQQAMAHFMSIKRSPEAELAGCGTIYATDVTPAQQDDTDGDDDSDTDSVFDENASVSSQSTSATTSSVFLAIPADEQNNNVYTHKDMDDTFM